MLNLPALSIAAYTALGIVSPTRSTLIVEDEPGLAPPGAKIWTNPGAVASVTVAFKATADTADTSEGIPNRSMLLTVNSAAAGSVPMTGVLLASRVSTSRFGLMGTNRPYVDNGLPLPVNTPAMSTMTCPPRCE
jgi:hypothetical protein